MHVGGIFATLVAHGSCVALASSKHTAADNQDCLPTFRLRASHGRTVARLSEAWTHCCALVQRRSLREAGVLIRTSLFTNGTPANVNPTTLSRGLGEHYDMSHYHMSQTPPSVHGRPGT